MIKKVKKYWGLLKEINFHDTSKHLKKCDVLLFCHDANRGINLGGKAYSPLLDSVQDELNKQGFVTQTIAHPWSELIGNKAYGNVIAINRSYFFATLKAVFLKQDFRCQLFKKILKQASPARIITIGCSDGLCKAARELKIHHAELLHGIGYNPIPWGWDKKNKESLPQEILTLDNVSTKTFKVLEKYEVKITQIQHPFLKRFTNDKINEMPNEWKITSPKKFKKEILVSLQWGYTEGLDCYPEFKGVLSNGIIPQELISVIEATKNKVFWRFRFHPVHLCNKKKYKIHFDLVDALINKFGNCEWVESTEKPLPIVLMRCNGHITMSSMSSYEAAQIGVKTLALCPTLNEGGVNERFFNDLVLNGCLIKNKADRFFIMNWLGK